VEASRAAGPADVARLAALARGGIEELAPTRGGAVWKAGEAPREPLEATFEDRLARPDTLVRVGTIDEVVIGYAVARVEDLADGSRLGVVDEIFVELEARGIGVGEAMMDDVVAWCREHGCLGIDAMALPGHRQTKNFFEDSGFTARKLVMHKPLGTDGVGDAP